jgi:hypothetical protein
MLCLGESIAAIVGEIATFKQSLRVKEKEKKVTNTVAMPGIHDWGGRVAVQ